MSWMLTSTGAAFDLQLAEPASISILDIAHHLSKIDRWNGACSRPYSVAEHSLFVVEILKAHGATSRSLLLYALMHDAHEAYTGDLSAPMKRVIGPAWNAIERRIESQVIARFNLACARAAHHEAVRWADLTALSTERAQLLPASAERLPTEYTHPAVTWWSFKDRAAFGWEDWRQAFLDQFEALSAEVPA